MVSGKLFLIFDYEKLKFCIIKTPNTMETLKKHLFLNKKISLLAAVDLLAPSYYEEKEDPDFYNFDAIITEELDITLKYIVETISDKLKITIEQFLQKTRKREIVQSRQLCMFMGRLYTKLSTAVIGEQIGGKNHSTVLHATKTVIDLYDTDKKFHKLVDELIAHFNYVTKTKMSVNVIRFNYK